MESFLFFCISFISLAFAESSPQTDIVISYHFGCFEKYLQQVLRISRVFENSFQACDDKENNDRRPLQHLDPEVEIKKYKHTSSEACFSLAICNLITDVARFFNCHSETAEKNENKFALMHLNASSVFIELNDQFDEEEKEILRCQLVAKRKYFLDSSTAYNEHLSCLNAFKRKC